MRKRKRFKTLLTLLLLAFLALLALDVRLAVRKYTLESDKITAPVRLAVLTDFHGCDYGSGGATLLSAVEAARPDAILLVGDMFSADGDADDELEVLRRLAVLAPAYYVTGNHEYWEYSVPGLLARIAETGVVVLDQSHETLLLNGQVINLCGVPDPCARDYANLPGTEDQLSLAAAGIAPEGFTILLAHRPELIETYAATGAFDLVVSGHAHGGQIRIPLLVNGLYAPNQGWFPAYAGGHYTVDGTELIVSRGLSTQAQMHIPRVFNRPELVIVDVQ